MEESGGSSSIDLTGAAGKGDTGGAKGNSTVLRRPGALSTTSSPTVGLADEADEVEEELIEEELSHASSGDDDIEGFESEAAQSRESDKF